MGTQCVEDQDEADLRRFRGLFDTYASALRRYAEQFVWSQDAAEDVVQEAFWRVWRRWRRINVETNIRAYLYAAARTQALDYLARERTEERRRQRSEPPGIVDEDPLSSPEHERLLQREVVSRAVQAVLETLPPRQREVARLRFGRQLNTDQIARELGMSPLTVKKHMARTMRALKDVLPAMLAHRRMA